MRLSSYRPHSSRTATFDWQYGIRLTLRFVSKPSLDDAISRLPNRGAVSADADPSRRAFFKLGMVGWEGITLGKYGDLAGIEIDPNDYEKPVPFTEENAIAMMANVHGFEAFIVEKCLNPVAFRPLSPGQNVERVENLSNTPGGTSAPGV